MEKEYCPNCITILKKDHKKIGGLSVWLVCPDCGFRKRPDTWNDKENEIQKFYNYKKRVNENNRDE